MNQKQMFYVSQRHIADADHHFMELINDKDNPLTNADLVQLVKRFPTRWARYSKFIGKLNS